MLNKIRNLSRGEKMVYVVALAIGAFGTVLFVGGGFI